MVGTGGFVVRADDVDASSADTTVRLDEAVGVGGSCWSTSDPSGKGASTPSVAAPGAKSSTPSPSFAPSYKELS